MIEASIPSRQDIAAAADRIQGHVRLTPVIEFEAGHGIDRTLWLKLDLLQPTGSFKVRGAFSRIIGADPAPSRVVAASGGNYGLAVAYAARELGVGADIFVPAETPQSKLDPLGRLGAEVHLIPGRYAEALAASEEWSADRDVLFCHAYDQFDVVAGQGTCGMEMAEQMPEVDTVLVAVGGGGLIGGIAAWYRDDAKVVAVETEGTAAMYAARTSGAPTDVEVSGLAASALGARRIGDIPWAVATRWVDDAVLVNDDQTAHAQRWLWDRSRLAAEPGAATPLAALLSGAYSPGPDERVGVLVCGGNVDPATVAAPA